MEKRRTTRLAANHLAVHLSQQHLGQHTVQQERQEYWHFIETPRQLNNSSTKRKSAELMKRKNAICVWARRECKYFSLSSHWCASCPGLKLFSFTYLIFHNNPRIKMYPQNMCLVVPVLCEVIINKPPSEHSLINIWTIAFLVSLIRTESNLWFKGGR